MTMIIKMRMVMIIKIWAWWSVMMMAMMLVLVAVQPRGISVQLQFLFTNCDPAGSLVVNITPRRWILIWYLILKPTFSLQAIANKQTWAREPGRGNQPWWIDAFCNFHVLHSVAVGIGRIGVGNIDGNQRWTWLWRSCFILCLAAEWQWFVAKWSLLQVVVSLGWGSQGMRNIKWFYLFHFQENYLHFPMRSILVDPSVDSFIWAGPTG